MKKCDRYFNVAFSCTEVSKIFYEFYMIIAARISLISQQQGKGLSVYVSKFAMPALLFKSMCELKFAGKSVNSVVKEYLMRKDLLIITVLIYIRTMHRVLRYFYVTVQDT